MNEPFCKVLIVEDSEANALLLNTYLSAHHAYVTIAKSKKEAIYHIINQFFDVVMIDVGLKNNEGLELATWLRNHQFQKPLIAITEIPYSQEKALAAGFDRFMIKPWNRRDLANKIQEVMLQKRRERAKELCNRAQFIAHP